MSVRHFDVDPDLSIGAYLERWDVQVLTKLCLVIVDPIMATFSLLSQIVQGLIDSWREDSTIRDRQWRLLDEFGLDVLPQRLQTIQEVAVTLTNGSSTSVASSFNPGSRCNAFAMAIASRGVTRP